MRITDVQTGTNVTEIADGLFLGIGPDTQFTGKINEITLEVR